jgi:hypothetical protein
MNGAKSMQFYFNNDFSTKLINSKGKVKNYFIIKIVISIVPLNFQSQFC